MSNNIGHSLDDLKWNYTIDQIYLLHERCLRRSMESDKMHAVILANALSYVSPHKDKSGVAKAGKAWKKFMDTLDWVKQSEKQQIQSKENIIKAFKGAKIPVKG